MTDLEDFWSVARWGRAYGYWAPEVYTNGYHRAQDIAGLAWGRRPVPALRGGVVVRTYRTALLGWIVVVDTGSASGRFRYDHYCHMHESSAIARGSSVAVGQSLGRLAQADESPGRAWSGPHLHFLTTTSTLGADNVNIPDADPRPIIRAALAAPAGVGGGVTVPARPNPAPSVSSTSDLILEDPMSKPTFYAKGDKADAVYAVYTDAGANIPAAALQGGVYCARRHVTLGELRGVQAKGEKLITLEQELLDELPKVYGSK